MAEPSLQVRGIIAAPLANSLLSSCHNPALSNQVCMIGHADPTRPLPALRYKAITDNGKLIRSAG